MVIIYSDEFKSELEAILDFIALDSKNRANEFSKKLKTEIAKTKIFPRSYRKNLSLNDDNVRDLIYKGYVVPFEIHKNRIEVLGIFKNNKHRLSKENENE